MLSQDLSSILLLELPPPGTDAGSRYAWPGRRHHCSGGDPLTEINGPSVGKGGISSVLSGVVDPLRAARNRVQKKLTKRLQEGLESSKINLSYSEALRVSLGLA